MFKTNTLLPGIAAALVVAMGVRGRPVEARHEPAGPAARPVPSQLVKMLSSDQAAVQWAAVRAMAQIGGQEAHPAVDALPSLQAIPIKNPFLPSAVRWAIESDKTLPWLAGGGMGGFGGFGMPPMGGGGGGPAGGMFGVALGGLYEAMVHEMGERLGPAARLLARKIMDGTAGDVPQWGYQILTCAPDESIKILVPYLADANMVMRERATVALGNMGPAASQAKDRVATAMAKVSSEGEGRLMKWCLREISRQ